MENVGRSMKIGDLVNLKMNPNWGVGILMGYRTNLGCWWVYWSHKGLCFQSEHRLEVISEGR